MTHKHLEKSPDKTPIAKTKPPTIARQTTNQDIGFSVEPARSVVSTLTDQAHRDCIPPPSAGMIEVEAPKSPALPKIEFDDLDRGDEISEEERERLDEAAKAFKALRNKKRASGSEKVLKTGGGVTVVFSTSGLNLEEILKDALTSIKKK